MSNDHVIETPGARIAGSIESGDLRGIRYPVPGRRGVAGWAGEDAVDRAVAAAVTARASWGSTPGADRAHALRAIAAELRDRVPELAELILTESGKRAPEAAAEVEFSAKYFDWFAEAAENSGIAAGPERPDRTFRVRQIPVGVVAAISTWNFPLSIPARKIAAAVAAGCPTVLKASERTPATGDRLVQICERHLPAGVIGSVMGDGAVLVPALVRHPDVAAVTFTGSIAIGEQVGVLAAASSTRVVLELGGRGPFIVRADADVDDAVENLLVAKLRNNGQSCIAANNVFVHESMRDRFWEVLADRVRSVRSGDPEDSSVDLGPLIDDPAAVRLEELVADADAAGATIVRGIHGPWSNSMAAALVDCSLATRLWDEELFGPVFAVRGYDDEVELADEINSWGVGLAGYVCGTDMDAAEALAAQLRIGIVGINNGAPNTPEVPFGGFGGSGIGREGGVSGYLAFVEEQTVSIAR